MSDANDSPEYLHGFTPQEQQRLRDQAAFVAPMIYPGIDFGGCHRILEIGSGVGAQTEILLRMFPGLHITCVDMNESQLGSAARSLAQLSFATGRYDLMKQDARHLDFSDETFDGAFICWVLEHMSDPSRVLKEIHRVLRSGARVIANEVMNASFFLYPHSEAIWSYWQAYNHFQEASGGDPNIGPKLGGLLLAAGFKNISTTPKWIHHDHRNPEDRIKALRYWRDLLLSGKNQLLQAGAISPHLPEKVSAEFLDLEKSEETVLFYAFIQAAAMRL